MLILVSTSGQSLDRWQWRNPLPQGNDLTSVCHAQGKWVTVGGGGVVIHSTNGIDWVQEHTGVGHTLHNVVFHEDLWVVVGDWGTILTSTDLKTWALRPSGTISSILGVVSGAGRFVAVGWDGVILSSMDGIFWRQEISGSADGFLSVAYGEGRFVAVGEAGLIVTSTNGIDWDLSTSPTLNLLWRVTHTSFGFLALELEGGGASDLLISTDGLTWTRRPLPTTTHHIFEGAGQLVACSIRGAAYTSTDAISWQRQFTGLQEHFDHGHYHNGTFMIVGRAGSILTSLDASTWVNRSTGLKQTFNDICAGNGLYVAVGHNGLVGASTDGRQWNVSYSLSREPLFGVCYGQGKYVAVGLLGMILNSNDGLSWGWGISETNTWFQGVTYGNGLFVAVGNEGRIMTSTNGYKSWISQSSGTLEDLYRVIYADGLFVATGDAATVLTSTNGVQWENMHIDAPSFVRLNDVAYGNGRFVTGNGYYVVWSDHGHHWNQTNVNVFLAEGYGFAFGHDHFLSVSGEGRVFSSRDGLHWTRRLSNTSQELYGVTFGSNAFIAVGSGGAILQSEGLVATSFNRIAATTQGICLEVAGEVGKVLQLEVSSDLMSWTNQTLFTNREASFEWVDPIPTSRQPRFYRIVEP